LSEKKKENLCKNKFNKIQDKYNTQIYTFRTKSVQNQIQQNAGQILDYGITVLLR